MCYYSWYLWDKQQFNGWGNIRKLLITGCIKSLIPFEARCITMNLAKLLKTEYFGINNDTQKLMWIK